MASGQCSNPSYNGNVSNASKILAKNWNALQFDPVRSSTPEKSFFNGNSTAVCRMPMEIGSQMAGDFSLDDPDLFADEDDEVADDFENAAVYEFIQSKRKTKYLFDGMNMIKLKPRKNAAVKAMMGKAYLLKQRITEKLCGTASNWKLSRRMTPSAGCALPAANNINNNNPMGVLSDYVPINGAAQIPTLIERICSEIEARMIESCEEGTYRISGSSAEIQQLKALFMANKNPDLVDIDLHTLTGCVKAFLRGLREPLIPTSMWPDFVEAGKINCGQAREELIKSLVMNLPDANRDTLAFFVPHLQRISACPKAKMPLSSMAKVFAPTIVGYSSREPGVELIETDQIIMAMEGIINVPSCVWDEILVG